MYWYTYFMDLKKSYRIYADNYNNLRLLTKSNVTPLK